MSHLEHSLQRWLGASFEVYAAGEQHYGETRDQEVIFQVNGNGPTSMAYVNPEDDPRKK